MSQKRAGSGGSLVPCADEGRSGAINHKVGMILYCANQGGTAGIELPSLSITTETGVFCFCYELECIVQQMGACYNRMVCSMSQPIRMCC